jgi:hypothetical protein
MTAAADARDRLAARFAPGWEPRLNLAVPDAWLPHLVELDTRLSETAPAYRVCQIKEKFGSLRYYLDADSIPREVAVQVRQLVAEAEDTSHLWPDDTEGE